MGIVLRQSFQNTLFMYLGITLGYVNKVLLYSNFLDKFQYGLVEFIVTASFIFAELGAAGMGLAVIKFLPFFRTKPAELQQFSLLVFWIPLAGIAISTAVLLLFGPWMVSPDRPDADLLLSNLFLIIPVGISLVYVTILTYWASSTYKTVVPTFLREIFLRAVQTAAILLFYWDIVGFTGLILLFVGSYVLQLLALYAYLIWLGKLKFKIFGKSLHPRYRKVVLTYSFTSLLYAVSTIVITRVDSLLLGFQAGLDQTAIYSLSVFLISVVYTPFLAINSIALPIVADALRKRDHPKIAKIFKQTASNSLFLGLVIYVLIVVNLDYFYTFLQEGYDAGKWVAVIYGISKLFEVSIGIGAGLIITSRYYQFNFWLNLLVGIFTILLNLILIPLWGIMGAVTGTGICIIACNFARLIFITKKFSLFPYTGKTLLVLAIGGIAILAGILMPETENAWIGIISRSAVCGIILVVLGLVLRISDEINNIWVTLVKKVRRRS